MKVETNFAFEKDFYSLVKFYRSDFKENSMLIILYQYDDTDAVAAEI